MGRDKARDHPMAARIQALRGLQSRGRVARRNRQQPAILSDHQVAFHRFALSRRHSQNECILHHQLGRSGGRCLSECQGHAGQRNQQTKIPQR